MSIMLSKMAQTIDQTVAGDPSAKIDRTIAEPAIRILRTLSNSDQLFDELGVDHQMCDALAQALEKATPALVSEPVPAMRLTEIADLLRAVDLSPYADVFVALCAEPLNTPSTSWSGQRIGTDSLFGPHAYWGVGTIAAQVRVYGAYTDGGELVGWFAVLIIAEDEEHGVMLDTVATFPEAMVAAQNRLTDMARDGDLETRIG